MSHSRTRAQSTLLSASHLPCPAYISSTTIQYDAVGPILSVFIVLGWVSTKLQWLSLPLILFFSPNLCDALGYM